MILIDTNVVLRFKNKQSPQHLGILSKLSDFEKQKETVVICPQVLYEFYVVATRPVERNGLGLSRQIALKEIEHLKSTFTLLSETIDLYNYWEELLKNYEIMGKTSHDARLVAFMQVHEIEQLYTLNTKDFRRFENIIRLL